MKTGTAHVYGDAIDTDRIIAGKYTKTLDLASLAAHALEDLDPTFASRVQAGDVVVGGHHFGCGSSREQAPLALLAAGVGLVVARSFARIFFRNALNVGLPVLEIPHHALRHGERVTYDVAQGWVRGESAPSPYEATPLPPFLCEVVRAGGLVNYLREKGDFPHD